MKVIDAGQVSRAEMRVRALEDEIARITEDTQREADGLFAQYQLSELLASGGSLPDLAAAVATEIARLARASRVAIWLAEPGRAELRLSTVVGIDRGAVPDRLATVEAVTQWADRVGSTTAVILAEDRPVGVVAVTVGQGLEADPEGIRVLQLTRHELAVAFRSAQLRQTLEGERRELTAIFEGATDAILQVDAERRVIRINHAALGLLGITPAATIDRQCGELLQCARAGDHGEDGCPLAEVLRTGSPIRIRETAAIAATGERVVLIGSYAQISTSDGDPRAIAILRDVTDARALQELRDSFVATVSHELRTPLALIKGYAETLLHLELDDAERRHYIERIDEVADRLRDLVTEILNISHLQADALILDRSPVTVAALVARLLADLGVAGGRERVVVSVQPGLPPIDADPLRIGQVLENLVGNALKYAPEPTPIRIVAALGQPGWVLVRVEDSGIGVPADDRTLILEPFHRGRNVRESRLPGTGLGLAIARRIVEAHGGRLWLDDREDGEAGTIASFTVPAVARRPFRSRRRHNPDAQAPCATDQVSPG
jgi:two-component system, OmpR family, phosphate regulon sensor histidine kinase PhoR